MMRALLHLWDPSLLFAQARLFLRVCDLGCVHDGGAAAAAVVVGWLSAQLQASTQRHVAAGFCHAIATGPPTHIRVRCVLVCWVNVLRSFAYIIPSHTRWRADKAAHNTHNTRMHIPEFEWV